MEMAPPEAMRVRFQTRVNCRAVVCGNDGKQTAAIKNLFYDAQQKAIGKNADQAAFPFDTY